MKKLALCLLITVALSLAWFGVDTMASARSEWGMSEFTAVLIVAFTCLYTIAGICTMIFIIESDNYGP